MKRAARQRVISFVVDVLDAVTQLREGARDIGRKMSYILAALAASRQNLTPPSACKDDHTCMFGAAEFVLK